MRLNQIIFKCNILQSMPAKKTNAIDITDTATDVSSIEPAAPKIEKRRKNAKVKTSTRAPSSYVLFSIDYRKEVALKFPGLSLGDVSKKCGEKWSELTSEEKDVWKTKSDTLKSERTPVVTNEEPKKKRKPSSYLCFSMDYRKRVLESEPNLSLGEVSKRCGVMWKTLSDEDKEKWKIKAME